MNCKRCKAGWSLGTRLASYYQITLIIVPTGLLMVHSSSPLARIVRAGSSSLLRNSTLVLSSSFLTWNVYSLSTIVNLSMTSPGTPGWTHMTLLAVALRPAPKTILCSSGMHFLAAVFEVATTVIIRWDSAPGAKLQAYSFDWCWRAYGQTDSLLLDIITHVCKLF